MEYKQKLFRQNKKMTSGSYTEISEQDNTYDSDTNNKLEKAYFNQNHYNNKVKDNQYFYNHGTETPMR